MAAEQFARWRGETSWNTLTASTLRIGVACSGLLTVLLALCFRPLLCRGAGLGAAACVATSPLLVYYSRMFIHEMPFTLFGMLSLLALLALLEHPRLLYATLLGAGMGLMASTRETVVISLFAWGIASLAWLKQTHPHETAGALARHVWEVKVPLLVFSLTLCLALIVLHYSDFLRHPEGFFDFFVTFFMYSPVAGHEKPAGYFFELLAWPKRSGGVWWTEAGVLILAVYGYLRCPPGTCRVACRFLVHSGLLHLAVYSAIAYKTPWLSCLGWVHFCLAAGVGMVQALADARGRSKGIVGAVLAVFLLWQATQSVRALGRFAADDRNPYAYVPTSADVVRMADWLEALATRQPELAEEPVSVIGTAYWPLPWYLRSFERVGYWPEFPEDAGSRPLLLIVSPEGVPGTDPVSTTHTLFPRGLRHEVPVTVAVRNDIWERETADPAP